jgi:hypothetical protein
MSIPNAKISVAESQDELCDAYCGRSHRHILEFAKDQASLLLDLKR